MSHLLDCDFCMETFRTDERRRMGCGYEPPLAAAFPWRPAAYVHDARDREAGPEACIGYTRRLPEVQEVVAAYPHWDRGALRDHVQGRPSRALLAGIAALHLEVRCVESQAMKKKEG